MRRLLCHSTQHSRASTAMAHLSSRCGGRGSRRAGRRADLGFFSMTSGARRAQGPPYRAQAVREDPALNASVSRLKPARGDRHAHRLASGHTAATSARGDFQEPYREDKVRAKFRGLAGVVLSRGAVTRVEERVERLAELPRLSDTVAALTPS